MLVLGQFGIKEWITFSPVWERTKKHFSVNIILNLSFLVSKYFFYWKRSVPRSVYEDKNNVAKSSIFVHVILGNNVIASFIDLVTPLIIGKLLLFHSKKKVFEIKPYLGSNTQHSVQCRHFYAFFLLYHSVNKKTFQPNNHILTEHFKLSRIIMFDLLTLWAFKMKTDFI